MKILFIHSDPDKSEFYNDYLSDLLLNGLRENYGKDVIDYPGSWYLYNDEVKLREIKYSKLWGKGFTLNNSLNDFKSFDRTDISNKIQNKFFDLVIYGSIRRSNLFLDLVIENKIKHIYIDGEDDTFIDTKYSNKSLYFKRELNKKVGNILPISFAIPKSKVVENINQNPKHLLAPLIPGKLDTYIYEKERDYYDMYFNSLFALTYKKAGWDCLRHYEILANGCLPLFLDLKNCPQETMKTLPKENLLSILNQNEFILSYYNPFKIFKKKFLSFSKIIKGINSLYKNKNVDVFLKNNENINILRNELLEYTKSELTTSKLAKYVIENTNNYFK